MLQSRRAFCGRTMKAISLVLILAVATLLGSGAEAADPPSKVELTISGMHCGSCADGIRAMLKRTDGVLAAEVSYEKREAVVEYDPSKTSPRQIVAAVEKLGYKAAVKT